MPICDFFFSFFPCSPLPSFAYFVALYSGRIVLDILYDLSQNIFLIKSEENELSSSVFKFPATFYHQVETGGNYTCIASAHDETDEAYVNITVETLPNTVSVSSNDNYFHKNGMLLPHTQKRWKDHYY